MNLHFSGGPFTARYGRVMSRLDLVYNSASGSFCEDHMAALAEALGKADFSVTPIPTKPEGAELSGQADIVCVHGGDGTLRDTVLAMGETAGQVPLCVAPSGTINLVARELGFPRDPEAFARKVGQAWETGPECWVHAPLYRLGELPIVSCLSIGPDSRAVARVSGLLKRRIGRFAYVAAMLEQLREWPREAMSFRGELVSGEPFSCTAEAVIVSASALYAGPFRLSPFAALQADSVELVTLPRATRMGMLRLAMAAVSGLPIDRFGLAKVRSVRRVEFDRCITPVQVDGDHIPDCAFAIEPSGLTLRYVA